MEDQTEKPPCVICGKPSQARLLCTAHYLRFTRQRREVPEEHRIAWEESLMADGKLGPNNQGKRLDSQPDLFEQHFSKFMEAIANKAITPKIKRNLQKAKETNDALEKAAKTAKKKKPTEQ